VSFIIPFAAGGGSDVWGRFDAQYLAIHLPGKPSVVIRNIPGGGSISGANLFAANAKGDGLTIFGTGGSTQFPYLLGLQTVKYDYNDWRIVLAAPTGGVTFVSRKLGVASLADLPKLRGQKLYYASQGVTSLDLVPLLAFRMLGLDVQFITGFPGRSEGLLAFEKGEVNVDFQTSAAYIRNAAPLAQNGTATPLFSWGVLDASGELVRDPNFPNLPHFAEAYEIITGKPPGGVEWDALRAFLLAGFPAQKLIVLPKDTPDDILEAYRGAVRAMLKDEDYLAKRDAFIGEYEQVTDKDAEALYASAIAISPAARAWVRNMLHEEHGVSFDK
jgi:tripartite-type tricarboxylate transporter receptor subunit TctC